ncbi:MAG: tape measure protein [Caloramator sp.]|jgi:tape measure domain-containing protein|uniref:tape measure protein n=1 Tax=Caloramator sp. TaxID=1871330 RepID=UPI001D77FA76|nr:tape measure protein [Caloramator sp.]MBZ4662764.1 tape measure protein [Caloramator sp.]
MNVGELFVKLSANLTRYEKDLETAQKKAKETGNSISNIFRNAVSFTIGQGMFELIRQGIKNAWDTSIGFNSQLQNNKIAFESLLGSADSANEFINSLIEFATKTPFTADKLLESSKQMLAMGFSADEVLPSLKAIGDAMAGMGQGTESVQGVIIALGQMRMAGRVNAQDMLQLVNRGVPAWQILADAMGKSTAEVRKMSEEGLIPAEFAVKALINGLEQRFPNMMSKMENTWTGTVSTIKDIWTQFISELSSKLFTNINGWLVKVKDFSSRFVQAFREGGLGFAILQTFGSNAFALFEVLRLSISSVINTLSSMFSFIMQHWNIFSPIVTGALIYAVALKITTVLTTLATIATKAWGVVQAVINGQLTATGGLLGLVSRAIGIYKVQMALASMQGIVFTGVLGKVKVALYSLWTALGPIGWIVLGISLLITAGMFLVKHWDAVKYYTLQAWGYMKVGILYAIYGIINGMKGLGVIFPFLKGTFNKALGVIQGAIQKEKQILAGRKNVYTQSKNATKDANSLEKTAKDLINKTSKATQDNTNKIQKNTKALKDRKKAIQENLQSFDELHKIQQNSSGGGVETPKLDNINGIQLPKLDGSNLFSSWEDIKSGLTSKWEDFEKKDTPSLWKKIKNSVVNTWNGLKEGLSNSWSSIKTTVVNTWENFKNSDVVNKWNEIKNKIADKYGELKSSLPSKWTEIKNNIITNWNNFKNSDVVNKWNEIKNKIVDKYGEVKTGLSTKWTTIKNDLVKAWDNLKNNEVNSKWNSLRNTITGKFTTVPSKIKDWGKNLINTIVEGMKAKYNELKRTMKNVAGVIADFLGFHSPTKEGPNSDADKWMPNLTNMLVGGLKHGQGRLKSVIGETSNLIAGLNGSYKISPQIQPVIAGIGSINGVVNPQQHNTNNKPIQINIQLGDRTIYKEIINGINDYQKQAGKTLIR